MPRFIVGGKYRVPIDADDFGKAREKFRSGDFNGEEIELDIEYVIKDVDEKSTLENRVGTD